MARRRTQEHMQIDIEPRLGKQKPVKGNNEPLRRMNEPLRRMDEPHCGIIEPVRGINETLRGRNGPVIQGERDVQIAPLIDRASLKAAVIQEDNYSRTMNTVKKYDLNLNLSESCDVIPSKTRELCARRSTERNFAIQSKVK